MTDQSTPITFDGYDPYSLPDRSGEHVTVQVITLWAKKPPAPFRGDVPSGRVLHGSAGELLERDGHFCRVRQGTVEGWVMFWFIKEFKDLEPWPDG